jgi:hypothetical protein
MESMPTGNVEVVKVATLLLLSVPVPSTVVPDLKVTIPVGVAVLELIVAVKVTACPDTDGFGDEVTEVALDARLTFCCSAGDLLPAKVESPL